MALLRVRGNLEWWKQAGVLCARVEAMLELKRSWPAAPARLLGLSVPSPLYPVTLQTLVPPTHYQAATGVYSVAAVAALRLGGVRRAAGRS